MSGDSRRSTNDDDAPAAPRARRVATPPSHRPTWLLLLSSLTLGYGGLLLVSGLSTLRDPHAAAQVPLTEPMAPAVEALWRQLTMVSAGVIARHLVAIRVSAIGSLVVALAMLYAAAAALSRDRNGRRATLAAAWLGIAYQLSSLAVAIPVAREFAQASAPVLSALLATANGTATADGPAGPMNPTGPAPAEGAGDDATAAMSAETAARLGQSAIVGIPVVMTAVGVLGSALLIFYFGGRRGRVLYGLEAAPVRLRPGPAPGPEPGDQA